MERLNLVIYPSPFTHESRILKETESVIKLGLLDRAVIAAVWRDGLKEEEQIDSARAVWRVKLLFSRLPKILPVEVLKYFELMGRIFFRFCFKNTKVVSCHSLSVLPIGLLFKILCRSKLVYDTHELETERTGLTGIRQKFSKVIERLIMPFVDELVVTSDGYASWYKKAYNRSDIKVFYNTPFKKDINSFRSNILRENLGLTNGETIFLYHGLLTKGRAIKILLNTFAKITGDKHLVIMGFGDLEEQVRDFASKYPNIHIHKSVSPDETLKFASSADVGISLIENVSLSYYHSFPNKVFEYIHCGLPVIVSNFPDMSSVVDKYGCGWKIGVNDREFEDLILNITKDEIDRKKSLALNSRDSFCWSNHWEDVKKIYQIAS